MSAPGDLQGLPWPEGEPGPLRAAASRLRGIAGGFDGTGSTLGGATAAGWSGMAQASYTSTLSRAGEAVTYLSGSLDRAAGALGDLAGVIEDAQDTVRRAAARLREAREAAARTQAAAEDARAAADSAQMAAAFGTAPLTGSDPLAAEAAAAEARALSAESTAADARAEADRVETWARGEADDAVDSVRRADAACASTLEASGLIPFGPVGPAASPAGAQAVWDFVYDVAGKPFNPFDPSLTPGERNAKWGEYASGILFGASEWTSRYASENWMRYEPGYWSRAPRWVSSYTRSTPSGGTTTVSGYMRRGVWEPAREVADDAARAQWATRAKWLGRGGAAAALVTAGVGQYFADEGNPNLDGSERTGRITAQTVTVGGASALGAWGGAAGGAAIGTMICPGVGTVIGGVVGGIVGGGVAGGIVDHFNDGVVDWAGDASNAVEEFADDALDKAGDVLDDLTPW
jgi:type VII secretion system ESX-1 substrate